MKKLLILVVVAVIIGIVAISVSAQEKKVENGDSSLDITNTDPITINSPVNIEEQNSTSEYSGQFMSSNSAGDSWKGQSEKANSEDLIEKLADHGEKQAKKDDNKKKDDKNKEDKDKHESEDPEGETLSLESTAYTASCDGCSGVTKTGVDLDANPDEKVIAVDPDVIPLESEVYVEGYGYATAEDTGSDIKGDRVDLFIPSEEDAMDWGRQTIDVTIVD